MAYIKLDDALKVCSDYGEWYADMNDQCVATIADNIYQEIVNLPTADVVEVVRCKDCIYYETHQPIHKKVCEKNEGHLIPMRPDDFCSYGERRDT